MNEEFNNNYQDSVEQQSSNPSFVKLQEFLRRNRGFDPHLTASDDQIHLYIERSQRSSENTSNEQKTANYDFLKLSYSAKGSISRVSASKGILESSEINEQDLKKLVMLSPERQQNSSGVLGPKNQNQKIFEHYRESLPLKKQQSLQYDKNGEMLQLQVPGKSQVFEMGQSIFKRSSSEDQQTKDNISDFKLSDTVRNSTEGHEQMRPSESQNHRTQFLNSFLTHRTQGSNQGLSQVAPKGNSHRQQFQNRVDELKKRLQERAAFHKLEQEAPEDSPMHIILPKYPNQQSKEELVKVESCSRPSGIESPSYSQPRQQSLSSQQNILKALLRGSDDVFDFSEIILKEQNNKELSGFGDGTIEYILEGTGGSGTSEMTHNIQKKSEVPLFSKKTDPSIDGSSIQPLNRSEDMPSKIHQDDQKKPGSSNRVSPIGFSSSHISYQFMPSNNQVSFAHTNSGSKILGNRDTSTPMSIFVPGPDQHAPDAIHVVTVPSEEKKIFERPPSCGSLKGILNIPFENRKFSLESVKSLKSRELMSKNSKRESSIRSDGMSLQDADSAQSVGSNNNNANFIKNQYISQILTVSEKRERSESVNEDPRLKIQLSAINQMQQQNDKNFEFNEEQFLNQMKLRDSCQSQPNVIEQIILENEALKKHVEELQFKLLLKKTENLKIEQKLEQIVQFQQSQDNLIKLIDYQFSKVKNSTSIELERYTINIRKSLVSKSIQCAPVMKDQNCQSAATKITKIQNILQTQKLRSNEMVEDQYLKTGSSLKLKIKKLSTQNSLKSMGSNSDQSYNQMSAVPLKRPDPILGQSLKSLRELQMSTPKVGLSKSISGQSLNLNLNLKKQISNPKNEQLLKSIAKKLEMKNQEKEIKVNELYYSTQMLKEKDNCHKRLGSAGQVDLVKISLPQRNHVKESSSFRSPAKSQRSPSKQLPSESRSSLNTTRFHEDIKFI